MNLTLSKTKLATIIFSFFIFIIPQKAYGWALDLAAVQLEAIAEKTGPIMSLLLLSFFFYITGVALLYIATFLLQTIISVTPIMLTVTRGDATPFVEIGWNFTAGIVNMILIIAFIVIAFAVIMGSEKIQFKKAIPRLILVALLTNFTLLFVGIGIDISNFLFSSVANQFLASQDGGNILYNAIAPILSFGADQIATQITWLIGMTVSMLVPYKNVAVQVAWVIGIPWIIPGIIQSLFYGLIMWLLSGMFFLFFVIFVMRIFIIQVLAVIAPLAFFCLIFEKTRKHWDEWLNHLIQWLFVGVTFIFLMYLAIGMAPLIGSLIEPIIDSGKDHPFYTAWFFDSIEQILSSLALLIYFIVVISISKKLIPKMANTIISQAKGLVAKTTPLAGAIMKGAARKERGEAAKREKEIREREKEEENPSFFRKMETRLMKVRSKIHHTGYHLAGKDSKNESRKDFAAEEKAKEDQFGNNYKGLAEDSRNPLRTDLERMAALSYAAKSGGAMALDNFSIQEMANILKTASDRGDSKLAKNVIKHKPELANIENLKEEVRAFENIKDIPRMKEAEMKVAFAKQVQSILKSDLQKSDTDLKDLYSDLAKLKKEKQTGKYTGDNTLGNIIDRIKEKEKEIEKKGAVAVYQISMQSLSNKDVKSLSDKTLKDDAFLEAIIKNKNISFFQAISEKDNGAEYIERIQKIMTGYSDLSKVNKTLFNQIKKTPAAQAMFSDVHEKIKREASNNGNNQDEVLEGQVTFDEIIDEDK